MSTHVSCEDCVYKEDFLLRIVFFFSSCNLLYSIRNSNLDSVSSVSSDSSNRRRSSSAVRLSIRHVRLTLSVSVDTSVRRCPFLLPFPLETSVDVPVPVPVPVPVGNVR
jgi:hypothetical protein